MKIKKFLILLSLILLSFKFINAEEKTELKENTKKENLDIADNSIIKYKWYIEEEVDGIYYPKGEKLEGYYENEYRIKYGNYTDWNYDYCKYSRVNYVIEDDADRMYKKIIDARYITFTDFKYDDNIKVYFNTREINFEIVEQSANMIVLDLKNLYEVGSIWLYVDTEKPYKIVFSYDKRQLKLSLSKYIENTKVLIPDETWVNEKSIYVDMYTRTDYTDSPFRFFLKLRALCRARQINTYRYKLVKKYYDDEYHEYVEGYIPDTNDYIIEYNGEIPTNTVIVTNTKKELIPVNNYIYLNNENLYNKIETEISDIEEKNEKIPQENKKVETKYIENEVIKKIYRTPKKMYLIIFILISIIVIETIKIFKKKVD